MTTAIQTAEPNDAHVDIEIAACLNLDAPKSFFLFAGAGSGKTRSLVRALQHIQNTSADRLRVKGQRVAVITFTNAASDEIKRRLLFDSLIDVRTIHSFAWSLIEGLNHDIREWLRVDLAEDIVQLKADEAKGRKGTKASASRLSKIESKTRRLQDLPYIKSFTYSPTGDNRGRDALNHAEVLKLTAHFLSAKPAMQSILAGRYPILLIDESQDTHRLLVDALFVVQSKLNERFLLGLIGDTMQRIYSDGKEGLGQGLPDNWSEPTKALNYRCPKRIVTLINKIRADGQQQITPSATPEGHVRLFVLPSSMADKPTAERVIAEHMAVITGDEQWNQPRAVKTLTLEHRMAASRLGFLDAFSALYDYESWRTSFLDGTLPVFRFFSEQVLPLIRAKRADDQFAIARIVKADSPLLSPASLRQSKDNRALLQDVSKAIGGLLELWRGTEDPSLLAVLQHVAKTNLFEIPDALQAHASGAIERAAADSSDEDEQEDRQTERDIAIQTFLSTPFSQIEPMAEYLAGKARFDTHQGVKGLEFDRVMVIMDDSEARGFMFKYDDLFGGKPLGDRTVEATKRLFYVTASRAKESLALVAYSASTERVKSFVLNEGWFAPGEIISELVVVDRLARSNNPV
ncbi:UvrD-helicase domain-containing protein [Burkholderia diffusa]|uniref:DNA 3'-5' helicase II n=1 Tax=Burkholderia diffusa TaxID=488732 RepID=A0A6P2J5E9_9BURK|nr:UvrD-helicase domain-containing protein [Burkholderia diffusa]KAB0659230.1 ATP-dependent helicase [Burkholderia diffusa]MBM2653380.1 ATP-dependent helicase [Burkholderia diffusa]VWB39060.1 pathogenesis-like protein [Burkholderia diffusa]